ncbi:hypothetical protein SDC9_190805 [bioreactor metagenome]|uniref:Uncharacterized protein n=1 Tax=bioreactor metagenome TaxID=1076179 RepID=A0A645HXC1_9ZZZZ
MDDVAQIVSAVHHLCFSKTDLQHRIFHALNDFFLGINGKITGFPVDRNLYIICLSKVVFAGCQ